MVSRRVRRAVLHEDNRAGRISDRVQVRRLSRIGRIAEQLTPLFFSRKTCADDQCALALVDLDSALVFPTRRSRNSPGSRVAGGPVQCQEGEQVAQLSSV